jgi:hypothetical protein
MQLPVRVKYLRKLVSNWFLDGSSTQQLSSDLNSIGEKGQHKQFVM